MKSTLRNILSLLLAVTVLCASTGVVIASHICSESQEADITIFERDGCCDTPGDDCASFPSADNHLKNNCCQLSVNYYRVEVNSLNQQLVKTEITLPPAAQIIFETGINPLIALPVKTVPEPFAFGKQRAGTTHFLYSIRLLLI